MILMAAVYGALVFHYDNEAAINEAIRELCELGKQLGARRYAICHQEDERTPERALTAASRCYLPKYGCFSWHLQQQ